MFSSKLVTNHCRCIWPSLICGLYAAVTIIWPESLLPRLEYVWHFYGGLQLAQLSLAKPGQKAPDTSPLGLSWPFSTPRPEMLSTSNSTFRQNHFRYFAFPLAWPKEEADGP